jgi:predicted lipid carrier protein YhbT
VEGLQVRITLHLLLTGVLVQGQLTLLVEEQVYQDKDLPVVLLPTHTPEAVVGAQDQSELRELKQSRQEMAVQGKYLQSQVLECFTQGAEEAELMLTEKPLVVVEAVVTGQKQALLLLMEE